MLIFSKICVFLMHVLLLAEMISETRFFSDQFSKFNIILTIVDGPVSLMMP